MFRFDAFTFLEGFCILLSGLLGALLHFYGQPFERGIFCNDPSISYPLRENMISTKMMFVISFCIPLIVIIIVEGILFRSLPRFQKKSLPGSNDRETNPMTQTSKENSYLKTVVRVFSIYLLGAGITWICMGVSKMATGRLRPHFLAACKPKELNLCLPGTINYIDHITCLGNVKQVREARLSFPSGHATFSIYCALFISFYLETRRVLNNLRFTRTFFQSLLLFSSLFVAFTRISDYWHHWSDVLAGLLLGTMSSVIVYFVHLRKLKSYNGIKNDGTTLEDTQLLSVKTTNDHTSNTCRS